MKKILLRAAALLLALVLAGCGTASPAETVPTEADKTDDNYRVCLLYTSPSPRDVEETRMPSSA